MILYHMLFGENLVEMKRFSGLISTSLYMIFIIFSKTLSQIISSKGFQVLSVNDLIQLLAEYFAVCSLGCFHLD